MNNTFIDKDKEDEQIDIDISELNKQLITVNFDETSSKKKKISKLNKEKKKLELSKSKLEIKVNEINLKMSSDAFYVPTKNERKILSKHSNLLHKIRLKEVNEGVKTIAAKNKKMENRRKLKTSIPRSTQQTIPYIADYEEGLFEVEPNKYSKLYLMNDINYLDAKEDEQINIFLKYGEFLNYFSEHINIAITIDNRVISIEDHERSIFYPMAKDKYDIHREEYNKILKKQLSEGNNDIQQTKYIAVTIDCDTPYEAILRFRKIDLEIKNNLRRIGTSASVLSTDERLSMLHDKFRKGREGELRINYDFIKEQGISSKDYIAPASFRFEKKYFMIGEEYYRCLHLCNLPASLSDSFLSEFVDVSFPLITTLNIKPVAQDKALRIIKKQLTGMEANKIEAQKKAVKAGYSPDTISHDLKQSLAQAEELLDDMINKNQKMFFLTFSVMVHGNTYEELELNCQELASKASQYTCQLMPFNWQQEDAFKSTLPMGVTANNLSVNRTLTTESTSIFIPFSTQELFQLGGFYYGMNQVSGNLILCNRTKMKTPSGFILGSSGAGKSFATKQEILNVLLKDSKTNVLIIDPENEYSNFAKAFGGLVLQISPYSEHHINPFEMSADYGLDIEDDTSIDISRKKEKALLKKSDYMMSLVESMLSVNGSNESTITPQQKSLVDRCVRNTYKEYLDHDFDLKYMPTFKTFQSYLDENKDSSEEARNLAEAVEYYTRGSMNIFSHLSNVSLDNRFVVFNVRDLGKQLKSMSLLIILDFIWNRMVNNFNKNIRTYCYVDEIHVLFAHLYSAIFLEQLYKRGRKYGLVITGITQNIEGILKSDMARGMISNSNFILMLSQSSEDLKILIPMLNMSNAQASYIINADPGHGLLFAENIIVPFRNSFPEESYLYKLMSTKFGENEDIDAFVDNLIKEQMQLDTDNRV